MSLGPLLPGRIPNSLLYERSLRNMNLQSRQYQQLQDQISTGQRFQTIGENPVAAIQTIVLQQALERNQQLGANVELNRSLLSASEDALGRVGDVFSQMQTFILAGLGDNVSPTEREQMAAEVDTLIQMVTNLGNTKFRGRYLFGGSQNGVAPFDIPSNNTGIRFNGDYHSIASYVTGDNLLINNVHPGEVFQPLAEVQGSDLNPAVAGQTRLTDLFGGQGIKPGLIDVTVDTGGGPVTERIDLTNAQTLEDVQLRLEAAFGGDLTVGFTTQGIQLTPAAGTVAVADVENGRTAAFLGIQSTPTASITSTDLNPRLSRQTPLALLNGGTGIGATLDNGLRITNGNRSAVIDLEGLTTIEDLFLAIEAADLDVMVGFNEDGSGLRIASRLSGADFSIAENGGENAARLGILTFSAETPLAALNMDKGVTVGGSADLEFVRRDGSSTTISLEGALTVQDVLDRINAEDPGVLVASLNSVGNGLVIQDDSGLGPLTLVENGVTHALRIHGTDPGIEELVGTGIGAKDTTDLLADLNDGVGVPTGPNTLDITRRDGTVLNISLAGAVTVQDVLDIVNAIDPGVLDLTFDPELGGFRLQDESGPGSLMVHDNDVSDGLGLVGESDGIQGLHGTDPNPQRAGGVLDLLYRLGEALRQGDNQELETLDKRVQAELREFNFQRGAVAARLKALDNQAATLDAQQMQALESLSRVFDTDMAKAITQFTNLEISIQATQQIAARTMQLNLFNFL